MSKKSYVELELAKMKAERDLLSRRIENMEESATPPQGEPLIQGYTAEQWQEIISGGYLCEFSDDDNFNEERGGIVKISEIYATGCISTKNRVDHRFCRPAQIKGVMRPIFVEPENKDVYVVMFDHDDSVLNNGHRVRYSSLNDLPNIKAKATKYIEV